MRRKIIVTLALALVLVSSSVLFAERISNWIVSPRFESPHFRFHSASGDTAPAKGLESVLERDYARLSAHPFPLPRRAGNYAGQHFDHDVYALIPAHWTPQPDSAFPPERTRTTLAHEMAHAFVFAINPDVKGWVTEGIAQYEQTAVFNDVIRKHGFASAIGKTIEAGRIPKFSELFAGHTVTSSEITGDYLFAGSFVDFAAVNYGFRSIAAFVKTNDFSSSFGKTEPEIWEERVQYLREHYVSQ